MPFADYAAIGGDRHVQAIGLVAGGVTLTAVCQCPVEYKWSLGV